MSRQTMCTTFACIVIGCAATLFLLNLFQFPQLLDWVLPSLLGVIGVLWLLDYQGRQQRHQ